ncbi:MAG: molybdenum cofactor biosynthesis protein MoaE [Burkholderiales bacterium]|nr:molybdenum cofactor biosynthesis protein MoaE [Phycisphaerae bacterium]
MPTDDHIAITSAAIDTAEALKDFSTSATGGVAIFLGCTRAERSSDGRDLVALDYQAYEEMAVRQLHALVAAARSRWPIIRCTLLHRIGRVALGEPSVLIAVGTPHRAESFDACRFLIDELKKSAAIWKQEIWTDGQTSWVPGTPVSPR